MIEEIYDRARAGDRTGVERIIDGATSPLQRAIAIASLEHVFIQLGRPDEAERHAKTIPATDSSSSLAKAEALSAAGAAWIWERDERSARANFRAAKSLVAEVPDLPYGRVMVLISIAAAELRGRLIGDGDATLRNAVEIAQMLRQRPVTRPGMIRRPEPPGIRYKDEAFRKIVEAAIRHRRVEIANYAAEVWSKTGDDVESAVADAWLHSGSTDEAIAAARKIKDPERRVSELLSIARSLLSDAGAPVF